MAQIIVNGETFELPTRYTMGELRIVERYTGGNDALTIARICGGIHVAIARVKPEVSFEEIQEVIDQIDPDQLDALDGGQSPPAEKTSGDNGSSTEDSTASSDAGQENENQSPTGSPDSAAGFRSFHGMSRI